MLLCGSLWGLRNDKHAYDFSAQLILVSWVNGPSAIYNAPTKTDNKRSKS